MAINDDLPYKHNKTSTNTNAKPNPLPKVQTSQNPRGRDHSPHSPYNSHAYGASLINTPKNQRGRRQPESPTPTPKPTSSTPQSPSQSSTSKTPIIKATDVPQWTWTNRETITYLTEVLISKVGKRRNEARILASKAIGDGFGPTLFLYTRETWAYWFGDEVALALDGLIYSMRDKEGAVPENVRIEHYERRRFSFEVGEREVLDKGEDGVGIGVGVGAEEDRRR